MAREARQIFRQKSLDKLSSPERLDQMLRIVKPQSWIVLLALGIGFGLVLTWAVVGRIPAKARGAAILVHPKKVVSFQAPADGQIEAILVDVGEHVEQGQLLATVKLPALEKQLAQERQQLELVRRHGALMRELEDRLAGEERDYIGEQRELLLARIDRIQKAADSYRERSERYLADQRANIETARQLSERLGVSLQERYDSFVKLHQDQSESKFALIEPQSDLFDNMLRRAELELKAEELELRRNNIQEYYDERMDRIRDLEIQRNRLRLTEMAVERRLLVDRLQLDRDVAEIEQRIGQLEVQLATEGRVSSAYAGSVLEITAVVGQQIAIGQRLGKMAITERNPQLKAIAYFAIKDGKKIEPGNPIRVSPSTVERERFGGIVGTVEQVSPYPVTTDAAAHQIGDQEIARALLGGEARIEVVAVLEADARSATGYRWTSGTGPDNVPITPGTTADVRVTLEQRAPITLVLPFLKSLFGDS